ncbi:relaxase/mobilization nuclease domain-containing protein [Cytophagaceae bacterium YF14B1]|uniref:Relaxase/mobilization nuclease domain-containing protein n=1 Tax=Xanthocytophaga flava TaxID=3048013 RepID=A0AAE3QVD6_9BACT|nr:relaxase/mobilization nuclease domain-containing protein [Xanthocytophaga flavus]MDJ1484220.1 relaxase/mobilization nuclease domain-containing protein [Xanthocytophaga flavus]
MTRNSVHISLNFDPSEKLSCEQLQEIAQTYMDKIGFGNQPYLVYEHLDAAHPHIHIVSIKVRSDGSRIDMQNIGRNQSEKARKEIEKAFGLVEASSNKQKPENKLLPVNVQKVQYGKNETKKAIYTILDFVLNNYKYTSLPELNAVLKQYNILADRGSEDSRVYQTNGLVYRLLNENGEKVGVPIKASDFHNKPTLAFLESRFIINLAARKPYQNRIRNAIDLALRTPTSITLPELVKALAKEGIASVLQQNAQGLLYGITYVDHRTRCVFKGSALGKAYSARSIIERCKQAVTQNDTASLESTLKSQAHSIANKNNIVSDKPSKNTPQSAELPQSSIPAQATDQSLVGTVLTTLLQSEQTVEYVPQDLKKKGRKRKRRTNRTHHSS